MRSTLFHAYGNWLVSITWMRFALLSVLLLISAEILSKLPPFNLPIGSTEHVTVTPPSPPKPPKPPKAGSEERAARHRDREEGQGRPRRHHLDRQERGADLAARRRAAARRQPPAAGAASAASAAASDASISLGDVGVEIRLPPGADSEAVREAVEEARQAVVEAIRESQQAVEEAAAEAAEEAGPCR